MLRPSAGARLAAIVRSQCHHRHRQLVLVGAARRSLTTSPCSKQEKQTSGEATKLKGTGSSNKSPASATEGSKPKPAAATVQKKADAAAASPDKRLLKASSSSSSSSKKTPAKGAADKKGSKAAGGRAATTGKGKGKLVAVAQDEAIEDDEEDGNSRGGRTKRFGKPSRYQVRHPRYDRGPLHPHQPPHPADPAARVFEPGPFTSERLWDHYHDTVAADFMLLRYHHYPPGTPKRTYEDRLRKWEGDSPYFQNRPLRAPRGASPRLLPVHRPITNRNIPRLEYIILHSFIPFAQKEIVALVGGGLALQSISGVRPQIGYSKTSVTQWNFTKYKPSSLSLKIEGPPVYKFLANCIDIVMPRIREFQGLDAKGDGKGTIMWGFTNEDLLLFPEIDVNIDSYPLKYIPGMHVHCVTNATNDDDARLLMSAFGLPIKGNVAANIK